MSQRNPFEMVGSCPPLLDVTVTPLVEMLFCSAPTPDQFARSTCMVPPVIVVPPDIAPPDNCVCLSMDILPRVLLVAPGEALRFTGHFTNQSDDCCDARPMIKLSLDIPCIPFNIVTYSIDIPTVAFATYPRISTDLHLTYMSCDIGIAGAIQMFMPDIVGGAVTDVIFNVPTLRYDCTVGSTFAYDTTRDGSIIRVDTVLQLAKKFEYGTSDFTGHITHVLGQVESKFKSAIAINYNENCLPYISGAIEIEMPTPNVDGWRVNYNQTTNTISINPQSIANVNQTLFFLFGYEDAPAGGGCTISYDLYNWGARTCIYLFVQLDTTGGTAHSLDVRSDASWPLSSFLSSGQLVIPIAEIRVPVGGTPTIVQHAVGIISIYVP